MLQIELHLITFSINLENIDSEFYWFGHNIQLPNNSVFLETQYCIAFVNIKPIVPGRKNFFLLNAHGLFCLFWFFQDVVIIPKEIRLRVEDLKDEEALDLFHTARYVSSKLERHFNATSLNFGIQDGPESGQSVPVNKPYLFLASLNFDFFIYKIIA